MSKNQKPTIEIILAFAFGVVFCTVLAIAGLRERPIDDPGQFFFLRVLAALSAAGVAAVIPGFLQIQLNWLKNTIRGGGALGVFLVIYLINPPGLINEQRKPSSSLPYFLSETTLVFEVLDVDEGVVDKKLERFDLVRNVRKSAEPYQVRDGTTGIDLTMQSVSHPTSNRIERLDSTITNLPFDVMKLMSIPSSRFPPNEDVLVHTVIEYVDCLRDETTFFAGHRVRYPTKVLNFVVRFPATRPCKMASIYSDDGARKPTLLQGAHPLICTDGRTVVFSVVNINEGDGYAVTFEW